MTRDITNLAFHDRRATMRCTARGAAWALRPGICGMVLGCVLAASAGGEVVLTRYYSESSTRQQAYDGADGEVKLESEGESWSVNDPVDFVSNIAFSGGNSLTDIGEYDGATYTAQASSSVTSSTTIALTGGPPGRISGIRGDGMGSASVSWGPAGIHTGSASARGGYGFNADFTVSSQPVEFTLTAVATGTARASANFFLSNHFGTPFLLHEIDIQRPGDDTLNVSGLLPPGTYVLSANAIASGSVGFGNTPGSQDESASISFDLTFVIPPGLRWTNVDGGLWGDGANWTGGEAPGAGDDVEFNLDDAYTVVLDSAVNGGAVNVGRGDVTFDLAGRNMALSSVSVGDVAGEPAILRVPDAANFNPLTIVVGAAEEAESALVLGSATAGEAISPPVVAFADEPQPLLAGTSLILANHSRMVMQNVNGEMSSIRVLPAPPGNLPVPYPTLIEQRDRLLIKNSNLNVSESLTIERGSEYVAGVGDEAGTFKAIASDVDVATVTVNAPAFLKDARLKAQDAVLASQPGAITVLTAEDASTVEIGGGGTLSVGEQGKATVKLRGFTRLNAPDARVTVADAGMGTVMISDQSEATAEIVDIGRQAGAMGMVSVSSAAGTSRLSAAEINVALEGTGELAVASGGRTDVAGSLYVSFVEDDGGGSNAAPADLAALTLPLGRGTLRVEGSGLVNAETVRIGEMGELIGNGTVATAEGVINGGVLKPGSSPGKLSIVGPYEQTESGRLEIEIGGTTPGSFDVLDVDGDVDMEGLIQLVFRDGFAPRQGDEFEFLTYTGVGNLANMSFEVQNLAPGFEFEVTYGLQGLRVKSLNDGMFVPEPFGGVLAIQWMLACSLWGVRREINGRWTDRQRSALAAV